MAMPPLLGTLPGVEAFCATYEAGSFTGAARSLGVTPQAVSRAVARLEGALGVALFRRSTRSLAPTEAARGYHEVCVRAMTLLADGERELATGRRAPGGQVRISAPTTYGHHRLLPSLGDFRARYPNVEVEVNLSNRNVDLVRDGHDMAIRMGEIDDQSLVCRSLGSFALGVYASPGYLARHGEPRHPDELARHACIGFVMPRSGRVLPWTFSPGPQSLAPGPGYRCSDDFLGAVAMARAGVGLVQAYDFLVEADVARGALVEVLRPFRGGRRSFSLLYPRGAGATRAARALIDFVVATARGDRAPGS